MIRITRETDYGIVLMTHMAQGSGRSYSAAALAKQRQLPLPMVSKILKALTRAGLLVSQRGAQGGYSLARSPEAISTLDIISALEGPLAITECSAEEICGCAYQHRCQVSTHWNRINSAIRQALENVSLLEMSRPEPIPVSLPISGDLQKIQP